MSDLFPYFTLGYQRFRQSLGVYLKMMRLTLLIAIPSAPLCYVWGAYLIKKLFYEGDAGAVFFGIFFGLPLLLLPVAALSMFAAPILNNMYLIFVREHLLHDSTITLKEAFCEAKARMNGRWRRYSKKVGQFTFFLALLVVFTAKAWGFIVIPLLLIPVLQLGCYLWAYQSEHSLLAFLKKHMKPLMGIIGLSLLAIPFSLLLIGLPALFALPLYFLHHIDGETIPFNG